MSKNLKEQDETTFVEQLKKNMMNKLVPDKLVSGNFEDFNTNIIYSGILDKYIDARTGEVIENEK